MNWQKRAEKVIPGGSQTYSKSSRYMTDPFFTTMALGSRIVTDEPTEHMNKEYVDYSMALGSIILGYKHKRWLTDLDIPHGFNFSTPHPLEVQVAEKLLEYFPHHDMVKFFKNGSDATEIAVRLARAYTGKDQVVWFNYHGFHDSYISCTEPAKGIPYNYRDSNWIGSNSWQYYKNEFSAFVVEPSHPDIEYISDFAKTNNIVLIFDEVLTGFRHGIGGLQKYIGIEPDITCLGKCMANGLPLSAVVGKKEIMNLVTEGVFASSTMGGETLSLSACLQTIKELELQPDYLWKIGKSWRDYAEGVIKSLQMEDIVEVIGYAPRCGYKFKDLKHQSIYQHELKNRDIFVNGINNFSLAHSAEDISYYCAMLDEVMPIVKEGNYDGKQISPIFKR